MNLGARGLDLIKSYEQLRLAAYQDGGGVWTIGYGHTGSVKPGDHITEEEASHLLIVDVAEAEGKVHAIDCHLDQSQYDALVSFAFNTGEIGATITARLRAGDYLGACAFMSEWRHDNGKSVKGLLRRRVAEMQLFLQD